MVVDYFHHSMPEHLEMLGVDPTRLPQRSDTLQYYSQESGKPIQERGAFRVLWLRFDAPIGFSTTNKIVYGEEAYMHLHILSPEHRQAGVGAACVRENAKLYFEALKLKRLYCEPNTFNVAPNRTLQAAGFTYLKTHRTVPGPINYHQAVTRWVLGVKQTAGSGLAI